MMNPLIQLKQTAPLFLVALLFAFFACFAIPASAQAGESYSIECEYIISSATATGKVTPQQGAGWSHNEQLFWDAPKPTPFFGWALGLWLRFNVPTTGAYEIIVHYTKAPD